MDIMQYYQTMTVQESRMRLQKYTRKNDGYLNIEKFGFYIYNILKALPFFKRFSQEILL